MSKVVLILLATSAGLGLLSLHLVKETRAGQATIAELQAQVATLEQQQAAPPVFAVVPLERPAVASTPEETESGNVAAAPIAATGAASSSSAKPTDVAHPMFGSREDRIRMMREGRERQRALMQDPDYRDALRVQNRINFARSYPGMAQELGLDQQQTDRFFDLLSDQQMRASEQLQPMWDMEGKDPATLDEQRRKIQEQAAQLQRKSEAEIAAQFGQEKLQSWKDYQATLGVRHQLEQMRGTLASQGMPLSEDLSKSMIKALAEANKATADELGAAMARGTAPTARVALSTGTLSAVSAMPTEMIERQLEATRQRHQRTLDAISPYLTFAQREAVEKEQEAQLKLQQAHLRLMQSQGSSEANAMFIGGPGSQALMVPAEAVPTR
jgi:hypothetical protein